MSKDDKNSMLRAVLLWSLVSTAVQMCVRNELENNHYTPEKKSLVDVAVVDLNDAMDLSLKMGTVSSCKKSVYDLSAVGLADFVEKYPTRDADIYKEEDSYTLSWMGELYERRITETFQQCQEGRSHYPHIDKSSELEDSMQTYRDIKEQYDTQILEPAKLTRS